MSGSVVLGMTISSSPSSSSSSSSSISLMTSSSAMDARRRTSGDSALDNRVDRSFLSAADSESESCCADRPARCCFSKTFSLFGLEGAEFEGVYVLPSGVTGLKLSEYKEFCPALLLEMVLMLIIESDGATEDDPALLPVARLPWLAFRMYDWSRNLPDPKRLLLMRLLALDPFVDESDDTEVMLCKAVGVLEDCNESLVGDAEDMRDPGSSLSVVEADCSLLASLPLGTFVRLDLACSRPNASKIISSSSSVT